MFDKQISNVLQIKFIVWLGPNTAYDFSLFNNASSTSAVRCQWNYCKESADTKFSNQSFTNTKIAIESFIASFWKIELT